jgi:diaminohydroxyphosphoribosylaminopyrimidine deaminase/5-amino-6-(5-phosphoribosylamino)uracil reductase
MGSDGRGLIGALGLTEMAQVIDLNITDVRMVGVDIRLTATITTAKKEAICLQE